MSSPERVSVAVIGGYGSFGANLCRLLVRIPNLELVIAGRRQDQAELLAQELRRTPNIAVRTLAFDVNGPEDLGALRRLDVRVAIDAAGPFQSFDYRFAEACISAGIHYIDLADSHRFVTGIAALDRAAKAHGVAVISGASTVPALSGAAVAELARGLVTMDRVKIAISPGNRAPRGVSLVRTILAQAGRPLPLLHDGTWRTIPGWGKLHRAEIRIDDDNSLSPGWLSFCDAPDLVLLPARYPSLKSVEFYAGLELSILHLGLWSMSWLVRARMLPTLEPLARPLRWIADCFRAWGSDRGGMLVELTGTASDGAPTTRRWTLIAEQGCGPTIPAAAAAALFHRIARGDAPRAGAYPCLDLLSLDEILAVVAHLPITTRVTEERCAGLFQGVLGAGFSHLPKAIRDLHDRAICGSASGQCDVDRGRSITARIISALFRLPPPGRDLPLTVILSAKGDQETWERNFGGYIMRSVLSGSKQSGYVIERFGPIAFTIHLRRGGARLNYDIVEGRFLGLSLPRWLLPKSATYEESLEDVFRFDVRISLPVIGLLAHYRGWLKPDATVNGAAAGRG
ncbi:MAG: DUF4166 domain-containing protein [Dongiaceae bacterium]